MVNLRALIVLNLKLFLFAFTAAFFISSLGNAHALIVSNWLLESTSIKTRDVSRAAVVAARAKHVYSCWNKPIFVYSYSLHARSYSPTLRPSRRFQVSARFPQRTHVYAGSELLHQFFVIVHNYPVP